MARRCAAAGEAKVLAEVHPHAVCNAVVYCSFVVEGSATGATLRVPAAAKAPFNLVGDGPQLRECFITCPLPQPGMSLGEVSVEGSDMEPFITWPLEVCAAAAQPSSSCSWYP